MLLAIALSLVVLACCPENEWKGLAPLKSTRADVEKMLGKPTPESKAPYAAMYKTKNERVFVRYSSGLCSVNSTNGWNVPESTVLLISVYPEVPPKFDETQFKKDGFEKRPDPEILSSIAYTNERDGISITVNSWSGVITSFDYFPEAKNNHLKCRTE